MPWWVWLVGLRLNRKDLGVPLVLEFWGPTWEPSSLPRPEWAGKTSFASPAPLALEDPSCLPLLFSPGFLPTPLGPIQPRWGLWGHRTQPECWAQFPVQLGRGNTRHVPPWSEPPKVPPGVWTSPHPCHLSRVLALSYLHLSPPALSPHILPFCLGVPPISVGVKVPHLRPADTLAVGRCKLHVFPHFLLDSAPQFSLFVEALLVFEAQDPSIEQYRKVAAALQNAVQCYCVIYEEKNRATTQTSLDHFFKRVDRIESSKEPEPVPSTLGMSEIAACHPSPTADDPSALPSPTSSPSSSQ